MFPSQSLLVLLDFARGRKSWGIEVFDACIDVLGYFGRAWLAQQQQVIAGIDEPDDEIVTVLETLASSQGSDGHPVASVPPMVVSILLSWLLKQLLNNI
jgi:hypothetical protein